MKKFNLMQIVPSLYSGGVERGTIDLANYLAKNYYHNFIVSNGGRMLSYLDKKYVNHHKLPVHSKNFFKMPFVANKINKLIKENKINILHIRSRAPAWLLPYIKKINLKTVSTFHNLYGHENILKKIYNNQLSKVDHIISISDYVKEEIIKIYNIEPRKVTVIYRGIDTNFFNPISINDLDFQNFINSKNINLEKKIILYPGRLTSWKGQFEFLEVVEHFKNQPIIFYFVGDNKNLSYYNKFIKEINKKNLKENCFILGHLNNDEIKMMYQCSDIVISAPNKPEGFGRIISESFSMKKIILAYDYGGAKNQFEGLSFKYKVSPKNHLDMKNKIEMVLQLPKNEIEKIGGLLRQHVINFFSNEKMLSSYKKFYEEIID